MRLLGISLIGPFFLVFLRDRYGVDPAILGLLYAAAALSALPVGAAGGLLADRIGRKRLILMAFVGECVTSGALALTAYAGSVLGMIVTYLIISPVFSLSGPATSAYVADLASGEARTRGFSLLRIAFNAGFAGGTAVGGLLLSFLAFADVVLVTVLVIVVVTLAFFAWLDPSPYDRAPHQNGTRAHAQSVRASFIRIGRDRLYLQVLAAFTIGWVLFGQYQFTLPIYAKGPMGIPYDILGIGFSINGLMVVFGQMPITRTMLGKRHTTIAIYGFIAYAGSFVALGVAGIVGLVPIVAFLAATTVMIVGENLLSIPMTTLPSNMAPPEEVGFYNGAYQTMTAIGSAAAGVLGGALLATVANPLALWSLLAVPAIPAIAILMAMGGRIDPKANRA